MTAVVQGFSHLQAGITMVGIVVIAACNVYRCLPGRR